MPYQLFFFGEKLARAVEEILLDCAHLDEIGVCVERLPAHEEDVVEMDPKRSNHVCEAVHPVAGSAF